MRQCSASQCRNALILVFLLVVINQIVSGGEQNKQILLQLRNSDRDVSVFKEAQHSVRLGVTWVRKQQEGDGSWRSSPSTTGLAIAGLLCSQAAAPVPGHIDRETLHTAIARGIRFILEATNDDGSIGVDYLQPRETSACTIALIAAGVQKHPKAIENGRRFLIALQCGQDEGYQPENLLYGGIGNTTNGGINVFDLQWALEALYLSESSEKVSYSPALVAPGVNDMPLSAAPFSATAPNAQGRSSSARKPLDNKAAKFLARCQNLKEINHSPLAGDDGGFTSTPVGEGAADRKSAVSATYAGLRALILVGVGKDDSRVRSAYKWIENHYSLTSHDAPQLGRQDLFFCYYLMAKALSAYGGDVLRDAEGKEHNWREDLIVKLASLQNGEGYWAHSGGSSEAKSAENCKVLSTAYCLLTLEVICAGY